jgi:hypothetical protein
MNTALTHGGTQMCGAGWGGGTVGTGWPKITGSLKRSVPALAGHGATQRCPGDHSTNHDAGFEYPDLLWRALIGRDALTQP